MGVKLKYALYLALFYPLAVLPFSVLYALSDFLYVIIYKCKKYRIKVVRANLRNSFPKKSEAELLEIEKEFYHHFCDNIVETIKLLHISDKQISKRVKLLHGELVTECANQNRPIVLYLGHYGNWEWVTSIAQMYKGPEMSLQIYKPLRDKAFDKLMLKLRSRFGSVSVPQKKTFRELLKAKMKYKCFIVGFIADHRSNSKISHHETMFLNQNTSFNVGGEEIGKRIKANYLYLDVKKVKRGYYELTVKTIHPMEDGGEYPYTRAYMQMLETTINNNPPYWLWSHRRWLYSKKK